MAACNVVSIRSQIPPSGNKTSAGMIMSDSIEYRTLVRCREKLVTAFTMDTMAVANALVSNDLLPPNVSSEIGELATSQGKANRLVDCILSKVLISHTHYNSFIVVFSQIPWLSDIIEFLKSTYGKLTNISIGREKIISFLGPPIWVFGYLSLFLFDHILL